MGQNSKQFGVNTNRSDKLHGQTDPDPKIVTEFNNEVSSWSRNVSAELKSSVAVEIESGDALAASIKDMLWPKVNSDEAIERISLRFKREGVFVHKGVGRGYEMQGGQVVKTAKTNTFARHPKEWFNPVVERHIPELETIIEKYCDNIVVDSLRILIL